MPLTYEQLVERAKLTHPLRRLEGHIGIVWSVDFSPDGRWLASGSADKTVRLWEVDTGQEVRPMEEHGGAVWSVIFSSDGRWLASGSEDNTVRLLEVQTGRVVRQMVGHKYDVYCVTFSSDGRWLASGSRDGTVRLWDVETGQEVRCMDGDTGSVLSVAFSEDRRWLVSGSANGVQLWDVETGREVDRKKGNWVWNVAFSPDSQQLIFCSDYSISVWNLSSKVKEFELSHEGGVNTQVWSPDRNVLFTRWKKTNHNNQWLSATTAWHIPTRQIIHTWEHQTSQGDRWQMSRALAVGPDGQLLVTYAPETLGTLEISDISMLECGPASVVVEQKPVVVIPQVQAHLYAHLRTLPLAHVQPHDLPPERLTSWLRGAGAAGWHLPLGLAHDLGCLLSGAGDQIRKPEHLPYDLDTLGYQAFLERVARYPLVREVSRWAVKPSDAVLGVILARLVEGLELPAEYGIPAGPEGVRFLKLLAQEIGKQPPSEVWKNTKLEIRPEWSGILPAQKLARIEANLARLDRQELRFLTQYGVPMGGAPDPRDLLDLLALTNLPEGVRAALGQTLKLLPRVAEVSMVGGAQIYPEGGYEGLARKGSLDSLLPSELAYGEEMFLYRVLNNEALYYGRERQRDVRRELVYIVTQVGCGMGGDGDILARAVLLALGQALGKRGYEVQYSFAGKELSIPRELQKPGEVARVLYYQDRGPAEPSNTLSGVLRQLRKWREVYRSRQVVWVLGEHFGEDEMKELAGDWKQLRVEAGQQAWFVRMGGNGARKNAPASAQYMERWQGLWTGILWEGQEGYMAEIPAPKPVKPKKHERSLEKWRMLAEQIKTVHVLKGHSNDVESVAFSPDSHWLASGSDDHTIRIWDVQTGQEVRSLDGHMGAVYSVSISPDGRWLASGSEDKTVRLWDVQKGQEMSRLAEHTWYVWSVAFSPDGHWLASGSFDHTVRLWDLQTGQEPRRLDRHTSTVRSVSFSPDGRWLALGSGDHTVRLWDGQTGQEVRRLDGHKDYVTSVAFSPDGHWLASGSGDHTVLLWDVETGKEVRRMEGHTNYVWSVAFSSDGRWLASGSSDKTVRLWDVQTGQEVHTLEGHMNHVRGVSFSPDGHWLASGSYDDTVRLWDVSMLRDE